MSDDEDRSGPLTKVVIGVAVTAIVTMAGAGLVTWATTRELERRVTTLERAGPGQAQALGGLEREITRLSTKVDTWRSADAAYRSRREQEIDRRLQDLTHALQQDRGRPRR